MSAHVCIASTADVGHPICRAPATHVDPAHGGWVCNTDHPAPCFSSIQPVRIQRRPNNYQIGQLAATSAWHGLRAALRYERAGTSSRKLLDGLIRQCESAILSNARIIARLYGVDTRFPCDLYELTRNGEWAQVGKPLPAFGAYCPSAISRKLAEVL